MTGLVGRPDPAATPAEPHGKRRFSWHELGPRVGSALVLMTVAVGSTLLGGLLFSAVWLLAAAVVFWEWQRLVAGSNPRSGLVAGIGALLVAGGFASGGDVSTALASLALGAVAVGGLAQTSRVLTGLGVVYAGLPLVALVVLRGSDPFGATAVFWLFAIVWGTDVMAFFGGRLLGGPKLSPRFSPAKTWSGFLVGVVSGSALGAAVAPSTCFACMVALGLAAGAVSQVGDIGESALKRRFGVKDSSTLIPGHGGVMDRLDGFMAAACFAAMIGVARCGIEAASRGLFHW